MTVDVKQAIEESVREYIAGAVGVAEELAPDAPLLTSNLLDSLGVYSLIVYLERKFRIRVRDDELLPENFETIGAITALVAGKVG